MPSRPELRELSEPANLDPDHPPLLSEQASTTMTRLRNLFCAGHAALADGRMLAVGGSYRDLRQGEFSDDLALQERTDYQEHLEGADHDIHVYDWRTRTWTYLAKMDNARWYPTCVTLPDERVFFCAGWRLGTTDILESTGIFDKGVNTTCQTYDPKRNCYSAVQEFCDRADLCHDLYPDLYPYLCVLPGGHLFLFAHDRAAVFDGKTFDALKRVGDPPLVDWCYTVDRGARTYPIQGNQVLLPLAYNARTADIIVIGGSTAEPGCASKDAAALQNAEIYRFDRDTSELRVLTETPLPLNSPRILCDAVQLPDGSIALVGGAAKGRNNQSSNPVTRAEICSSVFDPATGTFDAAQWSFHQDLKPDGTPETATVARYYHSASLLLPDGRVLTAGSTGDCFFPAEAAHPSGSQPEYRVEIFTPPYLRTGAPRPVIDSAPAEISCDGTPFDVQTETPGTKYVTLIRASSVTHSLNTDQRCIILPIVARFDDRLTLLPPLDNSIAPPGYYMLFLISNDGVPSRGRFLKVLGNWPPT
jgi:Galactose oxidase-like, Early set domain/Glyoxal oxidase N-terminus